MTFDELLEQTMELLQRRGRMSYQALKRQFDLDDVYLRDLITELTDVHQVAVDQDGVMLVWTGAAGAAAPLASDVLVPQTPAHLRSKILAARDFLAGERKQVTVLFADITDSTELIAARDPEEARQLLDPALHAMMEAVHRYEGTVNQVLGDGIMALFGAPVAHEDHAIRACYAALAMQAAMRQYSAALQRTHACTMRIRVGLHAGEVVVRAISNDLHMDYSAVGQTTHLAARLEQLAPPESIYMTSAVLRLVGGLVQAQPLGAVRVKGLAEPVALYELVGVSPTRRRLQAAAVRGLTPFIGRQAELDTLCQALARAHGGQPQVLLVVGEPGLGKSRLLYEFLHSAHVRGWFLVESAAASYGKNRPYLPVLDVLKRYCRIEARDDAATVRAKVSTSLLALDAGLQESLPALWALLDALPTEHPLLQLTVQQQRQRTHEAIRAMLMAVRQGQPLLLVCEDLHWLDAETQALLDYVTAQPPTSQLLVLVSARPEYHHTWQETVPVTHLRLTPLASSQILAFLQALLGDEHSVQALAPVLQHTQGNPFFLEESIQTLVELQALDGTRGAYRLTRPVPVVQVPATVQAVLAARLDRLPAQEKRLLQAAAVIGTDVPLPLLQSIAGLPESTLRRSLTHVQALDFLYEAQVSPEPVYTFKHALTHDVAYSSLLHEQRRRLHAQIMAALETLAPHRLGEHLERLAYHALRGEVWERAITYLRQAATRLAMHAAHQQAVTYLEQALEALRHLPDSPEAQALAIDLRFELRHVLYPLGEYERILDILPVAERLAAELGDTRRQGWASAYLTSSFLHQLDYDRALAAGQRALALAAPLVDTGLQVMARFFLGQVAYHLGNYRQAREVLEQNLTLLQGERAHEHFGLPYLPAVQSSAWLVRAQAELGLFEQGHARGTASLQLAEAADPFSVVHMHYSLAFVSLRQGELARAIPLLERALVLGQQLRLSAWFPVLASALGYAYALAERHGQALPLLEQAMERVTAQRTVFFHPVTLAWLGEAFGMVQRLDDAMVCAKLALALSRERQEQANEAWALRLLAVLQAQDPTGGATTAEALYTHALTLADTLGMRPLQAHCALGLGLVYLQTARLQRATTMLARAQGLYDSMAMAFWRSQAEALQRRLKGMS